MTRTSTTTGTATGNDLARQLTVAVSAVLAVIGDATMNASRAASSTRRASWAETDRCMRDTSFDHEGVPGGTVPFSPTRRADATRGRFRAGPTSRR